MANNRIMIVEDERIVAIDLEDRLTAMGYSVTGSVPTGEEAVLLAGKTRPDLALMDIKLQGDMDGIDAAGRIKEKFGIPTVFLTAFADSNTLQRAKQTEPAGYILKPFDELQLQTTLEIALHQIAIGNKLKESETRFRSVYWQSPVGIALVDKDWQLVDANPACLEIFGIEDGIIFRGVKVIPESDLANLKKTTNSDKGTLQIETAFNFEQSELLKCFKSLRSGTIYINCMFTPWIGPANEVDGYLVHIQDITDQRITEERMRHDALHDALTNLPNRAFFLQRLDEVLEHCKKDPMYLAAILFMDLDRFKFVNDSLGHAAGDRLLNIIANRLRNHVKESDFVARFGGDEFAVILEGINGPHEVVSVAERIRKEIAQPVSLRGNEIFTNASIGIAFSWQSGYQSDELVRCADIAMYRAKNNGRGQYAIFDSEMYTSIQANIQMEKDLRAAIERQEFVLHYQPIISFEDGTISGLAALLRWRHPTRGLIYPADFIPVAEETGLIIPIGDWVIQNACKQLKEWRETGFETIRISINISPKQIQSEYLISTMQKVLAEYDLPAGFVELEIKEAFIVRGAEMALEVVKNLRDLGLMITIDNFGTSYSSLDRLKRFPANIIKIDRSFLKNIAENKNDAAIVDAIIHMAHVLNLRVVAEGVENEGQIQALQPQCDEIQGWIVSPPLPVSDITPLLSRGKMDITRH